MNIEIQPASLEDKPVLQNLLQLCLHDYSEFNGKDVDAYGLFDYPYLDYYWTEPGRYPLLVRVGGKLAGFVLVRNLEADRDEPLWQMAEFFILRKYRRQGIGRSVAWQIFDRFEGRWEVTHYKDNLSAYGFWQRVIEKYQTLHPSSFFLKRSNAKPSSVK